MLLTDQTRARGTITTRSSMNFDNYFDGDYALNTEEERMIEDFSHEEVMKSIEMLSKDDQLNLALGLLKNSIDDLSKEQWQNLILYLKCKKDIKYNDKIEQKLLEYTFSRVILSTNYENYTLREMIVDYLNMYFDWCAEELDTLQPTTVFFTDIWLDFIKQDGIS